MVDQYGVHLVDDCHVAPNVAALLRSPGKSVSQIVRYELFVTTDDHGIITITTATFLPLEMIRHDSLVDSENLENRPKSLCAVPSLILTRRDDMDVAAGDGKKKGTQRQ